MINAVAQFVKRFSPRASYVPVLTGGVWLGVLVLAPISTAQGMNTIEIGAPPAAPDLAPPPPVRARLIPVKSEPLTDAPGTSPSQTNEPVTETRPQLAQRGGGALEPVYRQIEEELLLEVRLRDLVLADALPGYIDGSSLLLPLRSMAEVLEFPIGVDPASGTASGWYIKENRLFFMNVRRGSVVIDGRQGKFDPAMAEIHDDDIYVDIRLLSQWFPIDITFDVSNMLVGIASREPLAIEEKLSREDYRKRLFGAQGAGGEDTRHPVVKTPHKMLDWPMLSVDTDTRITRIKDGSHDLVTDYHLMTSGEVGLTNAELFVAGDNRSKITESRLRFERKDPDGQVLGSIPVTEIAAGDIYSPEVPLVSRTQIGRGFTVSSVPLDTPSEFDKITLNGDLPLGWDVELFRNEVLISFQSSSGDGRYNFSNIPLLFGVNVLKLAFYGPQGQQREEIRQFRVGAGLVRPGEVQFRVTGNQHDARVLYKKRTTTSELDGSTRMFAEAQLGITRNITAGVNMSALPTVQGQQRYLGLTSSTTIGNIYTRGDFIKQQGQGWAARLSGQTAIAGVSVIAQHDHYHSYFSEYMPSSTDPQTSVSKLRLDGSIPESVVPRIPFGLTLDHSIRRSKASDTKLTKRMSMALGRATVTNSLSGNLAKDAAGAIDKSLSGSVLVGGRIEDFRVRGQVGYQVAPIKEISTVALSGDWRITKEYQGRASLTRTLGVNKGTAYSVGATTAFDQLSAGLSADYTNEQEVIGRLTLNFSFSRDPASGDINMARGNISTKGAMSARVYLDNDANGTFSDGDVPLKGVGFTADGVPIKGRTAQNGFAYVAGLEPYRQQTFEVDTATLEDPFWVANPGGIRIVPRPGTTGEYEFPVVSTGEIDGTAFRVWQDGPGSAAGVKVQLIDAEGQLVREISTAYDGFFLFDFVAPGDYSLRVSPEQLAALNLAANQVHAITIKGDSTIVSGQDFVLR